jgi:hypothetical protein
MDRFNGPVFPATLLFYVANLTLRSSITTLHTVSFFMSWMLSEFCATIKTIKTITMNLVTMNQLKRFLKETLFASLFLSLTVFAWVRALLFEVPFSLTEDGTVLMKTIASGWLIIITIRIAWYSLLFFGEKLQDVKLKPILRTQWAIKLGVVIVLSTLLFACNV